MDYEFEPVPFDTLIGWVEDDPSELMPSMQRCLDHIRNIKPYRTGQFGIRPEALAEEFRVASHANIRGAEEARAFFESRFVPFRIRPSIGAGFVTAFYEPEIEVSEVRNGEFIYPFYRRPDDLVEVDDLNRPSGMDRNCVFGRKTPEGIVPFYDRKEIDLGALAGRGLEIAWARSRIDLFFVHVQGAARAIYPDGKVRRITYAAKAGHPFTGIGRYLISIGEIPEPEISMDAIREWLALHPDRQDEVFWQNRSYIFFRDAPVNDESLGPIAAAKVPLEPMRSIAVDRSIHTFSSLFFIRSPSLTHLTEGQPFARLMMAHDTGSAIIGAARADIFTGSGEHAGHLAGKVRNGADFFILVPRTVVAELGHGK